MSKAEAIKATGYTEEQLIVLGMISMKNQMAKARNESTDNESWDHYDGLVKAYAKMISEREHVLHD